jgi:formaldehyde-activating enzyme involved in methanogenesis
MHYLFISFFFKKLTELTTVCDNISNTLIASDNENDTCTSVSEEVDITDNEHGNIFAHHVPCNDDIIVISSDSSVSICNVNFLRY